jgi:hypothetical protein
MQKRSSRDINQMAAQIVAEATAGGTALHGKNPAAVALGRRGGLKGGKARAAILTPEKKREIATNAARARWAKKH